MSTKIFVSNIAFKSSAIDLKNLFARYGEVVSCNLVTDKATNKPKGFAFIEMDSPHAARRAIEKLGSTAFMGRTLNVLEARSTNPDMKKTDAATEQQTVVESQKSTPFKRLRKKPTSPDDPLT